jgi:DNA repair protein SbcD/Mre11
MKILHLSDIHMGSGFAHGRVNPATGLNSRLEDFVQSLATCIDRAIQEPVDVVLFGGDAFPDATPAPYIQEAFASQFRRLADHQIPTILLVGNHDQHAQGQGGASLSIYRTLGVPGIIVGDRLTTHRISTGNGSLQVMTIPWINRSALLTRPGHLMADNAKLGAEKLLAVGKGFSMPVSMLTRPCFDYVALGHVHRHQNLNKSNNPPVVYPGSIERVDFSEEKEDKGYVMIQIQTAANPPLTALDRSFQVDWEFCPLPVRPFVTVKVDASNAEDPQALILKAINKAKLEDAVVRLVYQITPQQTELISNPQLHELLAIAHSYTIQAELISQLTQPRLPELGVSANSPIDALTTYLDNRPDLVAISTAMIAAAQDLLAKDDILSEEIMVEAAP